MGNHRKFFPSPAFNNMTVDETQTGGANMTQDNHTPINPPCDKVISRLPAYLDNEVAPSEHDAISAHLAHCERCRAEKEQLLSLWGELQKIPISHASKDLSEKIMRALGEESGEMVAEPIRFSRLLPVSAAAAVLGLVVGGWMAEGLLNAEAERRGEESIAATMDAFAPNPYGSFVGGYLAMLENPGRR
jgi:anti-sigma factor RsiW